MYTGPEEHEAHHREQYPHCEQAVHDGEAHKWVLLICSRHGSKVREPAGEVIPVRGSDEAQETIPVTPRGDLPVRGSDEGKQETARYNPEGISL